MAKKVTDLPEIFTLGRTGNVLVVDDVDTLSKKMTKGSLGLVTHTPIKIANYTALFGDLVFYDPSGGTFTISAPLAPVLGARWALKNVTIDVTSVTIDGNNNNIEDPNTSTFLAIYNLAAALVSIDYLFDGTNWIIV